MTNSFPNPIRVMLVDDHAMRRVAVGEQFSGAEPKDIAIDARHAFEPPVA